VAFRGKKKEKPDKQLRNRIADRVSDDPRFTMHTGEKVLACPWCGEPAYPAAEGEQLVDFITLHVENRCPVAKGDPETPLMPVIALQERVEFHALIERFKAEASYRVFGSDGRWMCPYCAELQDVRAVGADGKRIPTPQIVHSIQRHLGRCYEYQGHPDTYLSMKEIKARMAAEAKRKKFGAEVAELMKTNAIMQFIDCEQKWVCPFCQQSITYVDMSTPLAREHAAPVQAAKHLASDCRGAKKTTTLSITKEQMEQVVGKINAEKGAGEPAAAQAAGPTPAAAAAFSSGGPGDTGYLQALRAEVLTLRDEVKLDKELAASMERARAVQRKMLPTDLPEVPGYELSHVFRSCDAVSGDFFDTFTVGGGRVCILIADVSGHGLDAALVMGMAKKAFNVRAQEDISAAEVMRKVNVDVFPDLEQGRFITAAFSILDPERHRLSYTRAGHNPALMWRAAAGEIEMMKPPGMMLGADAGARFDKALKQELVELAPGDVFVQYTDGVTEAMDAKDEEFGIGRLTEAVQRAASGPADVIIGSITTAIEKFTADRAQEDDVTVLVLRRLPA
jgi:serine phosphatase RsbU (regulator of sigma subunit)